MIGIGLRYYARLSEALFEDLAEATRSPTLKVGMCPLRLSGLSYGTDRGPNREWNRIPIHFSPEGRSPELLFFSEAAFHSDLQIEHDFKRWPSHSVSNNRARPCVCRICHGLRRTHHGLDWRFYSAKQIHPLGASQQRCPP